jgi:endonuclease/exonuclease/phosphatase family metal-dependent hydrolase
MAKKGVRPVKLLQLNVWSGRLQNQVSDFLRSESADIICLQEAISFNKKDAAVMRTVENIQADEKMEYSVMAPAFSFKLMEGTASFGNCVISRFPVKKSEIIFTHLEHKDNFDFNQDSGNVRNFIHAIIDLDGKLCNILTHHGYWINAHKNGDEETMRQMEKLGKYIDTLSGPIILTGDFNLAPHSESLGRINRRLSNLSVAHHLKTTRNQLTHKTEVCDYIFVNEQVNVKSFLASDELVSDHKALILEFEI